MQRLARRYRARLAKAFPKEGGAPVTICTSCSVKWTRDQRQLFIALTIVNGVAEGTTFVVDLRWSGHCPTFREMESDPKRTCGSYRTFA